MQKHTTRRATAVAASLGLIAALASPIAAHAATGTADTEISAEVQSAITLDVGPSVAFSLTPVGGNVTYGSGTVTATVSTNSATGYLLSLETVGATTALTSAATGSTLAASAGTSDDPAALSANTWGYRLDEGAFGDGTAAPSELSYAGVPASGAGTVIRDTATAVSSQDTIVRFGAAIDSTATTGQYVNTVRFTATTDR